MDYGWPESDCSDTYVERLVRIEDSINTGVAMIETDILERLDLIEKSINMKLNPLIDLLQTVISTNLKNTTIENESSNVNVNVNTNVPDLMYTSDSENVYISGNKTYDNR